MNIKVILAIVGTVISLAAFVPYMKDIFKRKTHPHVYTWLVWVLVQGTAAAGIIHGGGRWGALELSVGTLLVGFIFVLSLKFGTKNIRKVDALSLIVVLAAFILWWVFKKAEWAVVLVTIIDIAGYIPTIRKTYYEPWTETLVTWVAFTIGNLFAIAALQKFNLLTLIFIVSTTVANAFIAFLIWYRRFLHKRPSLL